MVRGTPGVSAVETKSGVWSGNWKLAKDCLYKSQALNGHRGEQPNAGSGRVAGWAECCLDFDHLSVNRTPSSVASTSPQVVCLVSSQSLSLCGARFETLKKPRKPKVKPTRRGRRATEEEQTPTKAKRSCIVTAVLPEVVGRVVLFIALSVRAHESVVNNFTIRGLFHHK